MKRAILVLMLFSAAKAGYSSDFPLEKLKAADIGANAVPAPAAPLREDAQAPQELLNKFRQVSSALMAVRDSLIWVSGDLDELDNRARRMIQLNSYDAFFQMDLRRMSADMARRFDDLRRASLDLRGLLGQAQKHPDLYRIARDMDMDAREILNYAWPALENSSQRLEWTVRSGKPEIVGYDAQWTAMDISRYCRQLSDQARNASYDAQNLVSATRP